MAKTKTTEGALQEPSPPEGTTEEKLLPPEGSSQTEVDNLVKATQDKLVELEDQLRGKDKEIAGLNRSHSRMDLELKRSKISQPAPITGVKALAEAMAEAADSNDYTKVRQVASNIETEQAQATQIADYQQRVMAGERAILDKLTEAGIDPNDDIAEPVMDWIEIGKRVDDFSIAEKKLAKLLKTKPKPESKVESEAEKKETEKVKHATMIKELEGAGYTFKTDAGGPVGSGSDAEFKKQWASGDLPATKENLEKARSLTGM